MSKEKQQGTRPVTRKSLFSKICKGDLVTIRGKGGERKGHAAGRDHGKWLIILEQNKGTALATKENTLAVSKPKKLVHPPKVGQRIVYDDGRRSVGTVVGVGPRSMRVLFDNRMEPTLICFDDPQWMDYITFDEWGN